MGPDPKPRPSSQIVISLGPAPLGSEWPLKPAPSCPSTFQLVSVHGQAEGLARARLPLSGALALGLGVGPVQLV